MANEITFGWTSGESLDAEVYSPAGVRRENPDVDLTEIGTTGLYVGSSTNIVAGDLVAIDDGTNIVGWGEYRTEVNCVLIEGADFTETLIGADGDTLESLSDQMDNLSAQKSQVLNVYDDRNP